jgi:hypothetical protein
MTSQPLGTVSTAGHWELEKQNMFVVVSGGYVLVGKRGSKASFQVDNSDHCLVQNLDSSSKVTTFIKEV